MSESDEDGDEFGNLPAIAPPLLSPLRAESIASLDESESDGDVVEEEEEEEESEREVEGDGDESSEGDADGQHVPRRKKRAKVSNHIQYNPPCFYLAPNSSPPL
jgi:hypothetical protein